MAFRLPTLNLKCRIWHAYDIAGLGLPPAISPAAADVPCQLRNTLTGLQVLTPFSGSGQINELVLLGKRTDVRPSQPAATPDLLEVPQGTGRFYTCLGVADMHRGFANEYRVALIVQLGDHVGGYTVPIP